MQFVLYVLELIAVWSIVSLATNLVVGYTGMFAMGNAAYFGIGAYISFILNIYLRFPYLVTIPIAMAGTAMVAVATLLPILRLEGFYFAVATLGVNFVIVDLLHNLMPTIGYTDGLFGIIVPAWLNLPVYRFIFIVFAAGVVFIAIWSLTHSPWGRLIEAIRDDKMAVESLGKNPKKYKCAVWTISGGLCGLAGSLYGVIMSYIDPTQFIFVYSIYLLVYIGFGGLASILGSILGPLILIIFSQLPRFIGLKSSLIGPLEQISYAILLILMMMFRRRGLVGRYEFIE